MNEKQNKEIKKEEKQTDLETLFGITKELVDKSKDILPVLDLGNADIGSKFKIEFIESKPRIIETPNSDFSDTAKVINVKEISLGNEEFEGAVKYSLFLSSKSLALGVGKLWIEHNKDLEGVKCLISVGETNYKKFGKNRCYTVQEITN